MESSCGFEKRISCLLGKCPNNQRETKLFLEDAGQETPEIHPTVFLLWFSFSPSFSGQGETSWLFLQNLPTEEPRGSWMPPVLTLLHICRLLQQQSQKRCFGAWKGRDLWRAFHRMVNSGKKSQCFKRNLGCRCDGIHPTSFLPSKLWIFLHSPLIMRKKTTVLRVVEIISSSCLCATAISCKNGFIGDVLSVPQIIGVLCAGFTAQKIPQGMVKKYLILSQHASSSDS